jgi:hypothetical protein
MSDGMSKTKITGTLINMARTVESKLTSQFEDFQDMNLVFGSDAKFVKARESTFKELEITRKQQKVVYMKAKEAADAAE